MKYEEAIDRFEYSDRNMHCDYNSCDMECDKCLHAMEILIKSAQKQIPKKPWKQVTNDTCIYYHWGCVECGRELYKKTNYCHSCGQALDWSDEE